MVTVKELRDQLINEFGLSEEEVEQIKGKTALQETLESLSENVSTNDIFETLEESSAVIVENTDDEVPSYNSSEWSDYVMTQFTDDELIDGNPNINGLRRVTNELLGEIIKSVPTSVVPCMNGIICSYQIEIVWELTPDGDKGLGDYGIKVFGGVADANEDNTDRPYSNYLSAMAETRAEVRALRKALRLKGIAHEEITKTDKEEQVVTWDSREGNITPQQISLLKNKCDTLKIDIYAFTNFHKGKDLEKLSQEEAASLCQDINQYQTKHKEIPEEIKVGYKGSV